MEIPVQQRTQEWYDLRKSVQLTASNFGEALGVGRGKPFDFLQYYLDEEEEEETSSAMQHGIDMEVIIGEMYQLLTGSQIRESGFWVPAKGDELEHLVGVSPDAIVEMKNGKRGLCEFKAPVFSLYGQNAPHGIPRHYMAQIQGQLGVSKMTWCDFLAVCVRTKSLMLKRVYFCDIYWKTVSKLLKEFCLAVKASRLTGCVPEDNEYVNSIKQRESFYSKFLSGESSIRVENLLKVNDTNNTFCGPSDVWMTFECLMGTDLEISSDTLTSLQDKIDRIDQEILMKQNIGV